MTHNLNPTSKTQAVHVPYLVDEFHVDVAGDGLFLLLIDKACAVQALENALSRHIAVNFPHLIPGVCLGWSEALQRMHHHDIRGCDPL